MDTVQIKTEQQEKNEKKKNRKQLMELIKELNEDCEKFKKIHDFIEHAEKLKPVLLSYAAQVNYPADKVKEIVDMIDRLDEAKDKIESACELVEKIKDLDPTLFLTPSVASQILQYLWQNPLLIGAAVVGVIIIAVGANYFLAPGIQLQITNHGCTNTIPVPPEFLATFPRFTLWKNPIQDGQSDSATIPPISFKVDASDSQNVKIYIYGLIPMPAFPIGTDVTSVTLNTQEVLNQSGSLNFTAGLNSVVVTCR